MALCLLLHSAQQISVPLGHRPLPRRRHGYRATGSRAPFVEPDF